MTQTLDPHTLRRQLTQVLEHLKRSGIGHIPALLPEDLPADIVQAVERATSGQAANSASASNLSPASTALGASSSAGIQPNETSKPAVSAQDRPHAGELASQPAQAAASPAPVGVPSSWQLPVLPLGEREGAILPIDTEVKDCKECSEIVGFRQQTVLGEGRLDAQVCFIGEAPGADEDRTGRPFVGKAGQLLTKIILAMKLEREDVYILNALKCRPPQNRTPMATEIESCRGFAQRQLEIIQPQYIVCLGAVAVRSLLGVEQSIGRLRGRFHAYRGAKVVVTYHPSYLLRNESAKRLVWEDMKMLMAEMEADGNGVGS
jgi:DNA polymerase